MNRYRQTITEAVDPLFRLEDTRLAPVQVEPANVAAPAEVRNKAVTLKISPFPS